MEANPTRFLVLMCTHNGEAHLQGQLDSLLGQTLAPHAVEVHDWGSTDQTLALLRGAQNGRANECNIRLTRHDEVPGPAISFRRALEHTLQTRSDFDYLLFCDQDDVWQTEKLAAFDAVIRSQGAPDFLHSDARLVDEGGYAISSSLFGPGMRFRQPVRLNSPAVMVLNTIPGMVMAVSRRFLLDSKGVWARDGWVMHDWSMVVACYALGASSAYVPRALVDYRQHRKNVMGGLAASRRGPREQLRHAKRQVKLVRTQFEASELRISRFAALSALCREPALEPLSRIRMVAGYLLFW